MSFNVSVAQIKLNLFTHHIPLLQVIFNSIEPSRPLENSVTYEQEGEETSFA